MTICGSRSPGYDSCASRDALSASATDLYSPCRKESVSCLPPPKGAWSVHSNRETGVPYWSTLSRYHWSPPRRSFGLVPLFPTQKDRVPVYPTLPTSILVEGTGNRQRKRITRLISLPLQTTEVVVLVLSSRGPDARE